MDPLRWEVHLCIVMSLPFATTFSYIAERINPYYNDLVGSKSRQKPNNLPEIGWYMVGALFMEGNNEFTLNRTQ